MRYALWTVVLMSFVVGSLQPALAADTKADQQIAAFKEQYDALVVAIKQEEMAEYEAMPKPQYADKFSATFRSRHGVELQAAVWGNKDAGTYPEDTETGKALNGLWRQYIEEYPTWKAEYKKASNSAALKSLKKSYEKSRDQIKKQYKDMAKKYSNAGKGYPGSSKYLKDYKKKLDKEEDKALDRLKSEYNKRRDQFKKSSKGGQYKEKIDALQDAVTDLIKAEKKLRTKEMAGINKAKVLCAQRLRARIAELSVHPGVKQMLQCVILKDKMDTFITTADMLTNAGNTAKAADYKKRAASASTTLGPLQRECIAALTENPLPMAQQPEAIIPETSDTVGVN